MAKKRGGQIKPAGERKSIPIQVRMQESEVAAFEQAAELCGLDRSAWMRMRLRDAAIVDLSKHGLTPQFLPQLASGEKGNRTQRA